MAVACDSQVVEVGAHHGAASCVTRGRDMHGQLHVVRLPLCLMQVGQYGGLLLRRSTLERLQGVEGYDPRGHLSGLQAGRQCGARFGEGGGGAEDDDDRVTCFHFQPRLQHNTDMMIKNMVITDMMIKNMMICLGAASCCMWLYGFLGQFSTSAS